MRTINKWPATNGRHIWAAAFRWRDYCCRDWVIKSQAIQASQHIAQYWIYLLITLRNWVHTAINYIWIVLCELDIYVRHNSEANLARNSKSLGVLPANNKQKVTPTWTACQQLVLVLGLCRIIYLFPSSDWQYKNEINAGSGRSLMVKVVT